MPEDPSRRPADGLEADGLEKVWAALSSRGYALTSDREIGLPAGFRENFCQDYYNSEVLHHDPGDKPADRERARDVIHYKWNDETLDLQTYDRITITDRADIPGKREHTRVQLLKDPRAKQLICTLLGLVPAGRRQDEGTFGVNLFRTFTNVVTKPHRDDEEFVIIYVVDRIGTGAETYLYNPEDVKDGQDQPEPVLRQQLNPGDIIIFDDKTFLHGATPLVSPPGGTARRDALVCTVDYRSTYLDPSAVN
jgi:hypothetical protein